MTYLSVNGHRIRSNAKHGTDDPPIRIARTRSDSKPTYAHEVAIKGPSVLVYDAGKPILKCGARLAIRTTSEVEVLR